LEKTPRRAQRKGSKKAERSRVSFSWALRSKTESNPQEFGRGENLNLRGAHRGSFKKVGYNEGLTSRACALRREKRHWGRRRPEGGKGQGGESLGVGKDRPSFGFTKKLTLEGSKTGEAGGKKLERDLGDDVHELVTNSKRGGGTRKTAILNAPKLVPHVPGLSTLEENRKTEVKGFS